MSRGSGWMRLIDVYVNVNFESYSSPLSKTMVMTLGVGGFKLSCVREMHLALRDRGGEKIP